MTESELKEFETLLMEHLREVKTSHDILSEDRLKQTDRNEIESGDWSQAIENEEVESRIILSEEYYMEKIQHALLRIQKGTYGLCEGCGNEIPLERLRAKPSVSLCVTCQEKKEERER